MIVVTAEQMREMDRLTIQKYGVPSLTLMERAGQAVTQAILQNFARNAKQGVLIVAGKGNNGGDGFVVARLLKKKRIPCEVALLARKDELSPDAVHNLRAYLKLKGKVTEISADQLELLGECMSQKGLIVDAILGTGVKNEVRGLFGDAITMINTSGVPVVAVDIPSGLHTDNGTPLGVAVQAEMTVALGFAKLGEVIYPGLNYVGVLVVADIGIAEAAVAEVAPKTELLDRETIRWLVPRRAPDTHKGTYGHLLVVAGSRGKTGAAILACRAAMRTGAGLVTLAAPRSLNNIFAASLIEVMTEPLGDNAAEELEPLGDDDWHRLLERKDALLFGPGIGVTTATQNNLRWLLRNLDLPWVIDADGLNNLALEIGRLRHAKTAPVLTPHPGEMARLTGEKPGKKVTDRLAVAQAFAQERNVCLVLKGHRTLIAFPDGRVWINPTGTPAMAKGGSGDILTGMIAGLIAQFPSDICTAVRAAVWLHGRAGEIGAAELTEQCLIATDLLRYLPGAIRECV